MTPTTISLMGFVILIALMFLRVPVGFVMAIVGFTGFGYPVSRNAALNLLARDYFSIFSSYNLTVTPLFM